LTNGPGRFQGTPRWSPDGRSIVFDSQGDDGRWDVYSIESAGGQPSRITASPADDAVPSFSRDGKWIYFGSDRSGRFEVWRVPSRGGEAVQITSNGGFVAFEAPDGKTLYYTKGGYAGLGPYPLFARPIAGGPERQVLDAVMARSFVPVEDGIYHIGKAAADRTYPLQFFDFAAGRSRVITRIELIPSQSISVAPDRRTVLFSVSKPSNDDLILIENFR
jgi:dipeptidyl aminopeptidase/acylaminoacyl peptidase